MSIQNSLKPFKFFVLRPIDIFSPLLRAVLVLFVVASFSLFFYLTFSDQNPTCRGCYDAHRYSNHRKVKAFDAGEQPTNISHLVFGIGGSVKTWNERRHYCELWWKKNVTRGFVWLEEKPEYAWPESSPPYRISADTSKFNYTCWYGFRSAIRVARIIKETYEMGLENVRWFVMGDDDTVFFVDNLIDMLGRYDHNQMYYIGANSESVEQDVVHSYAMAYGGGGFAISYPLATVLVQILDGCIDRYAHMYGSDQKIQGCITEIGVPLTKELGFHQLDIRGNPYGILAAHPIAPLVSLHHLDYVQSIFPAMTQPDSLKKLYKAYETDPSRALQHSFCYDTVRNWSVSVSWGYSVQLYPWLVTAKEMETAFLTYQTWKTNSNEPFTFDTQPVSSDPCKRPILYFLNSTERLGSRQWRTLTTYQRYTEEARCDRPDYAPALAVESFNVSAPEFDRRLWNQAPRRQCCNVVHDKNSVDGEVEVHIRDCHLSESVTPPS
ncbi:uncharacterized protein E5676_scaffold352G001460 [Cucumis melo var. makuwa]|uniref:Uncharacterized protein n=1 Tax=Cucumis melo var. makuwa TaxID=1194695 RepID=A0A5D3DN33_CUCMM|nr:uncharacterized protein E6C27_scaffold236G004620 [Cucumis melo var. makuwa]TYK25027.1 uncharacterized protein E5676_scaffold352G001460 [Cucumis melo var. makuwa]